MSLTIRLAIAHSATFSGNHLRLPPQNNAFRACTLRCDFPWRDQYSKRSHASIISVFSYSQRINQGVFQPCFRIIRISITSPVPRTPRQKSTLLAETTNFVALIGSGIRKRGQPPAGLFAVSALGAIEGLHERKISGSSEPQRANTKEEISAKRQQSHLSATNSASQIRSLP